MVRNVGNVLLQAARFLILCTSLWFVLAVSPPSAHLAFAQDASKMCLPQPNQCGCVSCGCGTNYGRPSCPPGQSLYDDYCLPDCPAGWQRYPGYPGVCLPPCWHGCPPGYDQVPLPQCPDYQVRDLRNPDRCVPDYGRLNNLDQCPDTMEYSSQTGRCELKCADGQYRDEYGLCQSYYQRECQPGLARDAETGKCLPPGSWPPNYEWICLPQCPQGWTRDIYHPTRCLPPTEKCPEGSENNNGRCVPICEPGTQRDPYGYCVPPTCPDGTYPNLRGRCEQPECPPNSRRNDNGVCEPVDQGCPPDTTNIRGQCVPDCNQNEERDENGRCVPVDRGCDQGEEEVNGQCVPICKQGLRRDANGRCVPERQGCKQGTVAFKGRCVEICNKGERRTSDGRCVPVLTPCKKGEFRDKNGRCRTVEREPVCPKGFRPDGQGGCTRIVPLVPQGCDEGEIYNKRTKRCEPIRRARPQPEPEDNFQDEPEPPPIRRINPNIQVTPEMLEKLIPQKRPRPQINEQEDCPKGMFRDNNGRCVEG